MGDRRGDRGFRFFFFNNNGLSGFHEISIYPELILGVLPRIGGESMW
jgi:hypothetical protein